MSINIRLFLIFLCAIVLAIKGAASNNDGVYIVEAESVVFFSDAFQIINLKNEEKLVLYSCPTPTIIKKEIKVTKKNKIVHASNNFKNILKEEEIKIPLSYIVFNVKNTKNLNFSILKQRDTNIVFYMSIVLDPLSSTCILDYLEFVYIYILQNQILRLFFYIYPSSFWNLNIQYALIGLFLSIFFYKNVSKKAKSPTCLLKRGPPHQDFFRIVKIKLNKPNYQKLKMFNRLYSKKKWI